MPPQVLKPSSLEIHRGYLHQNTPPFRNLIKSATDSLSSLIRFSNCDNTTVDSIIIKYEATNMTSSQANLYQGLISIQKLHNTQWLIQKIKDTLKHNYLLLLDSHHEEIPNMWKKLHMKVKPRLMKWRTKLLRLGNFIILLFG